MHPHRPRRRFGQHFLVDIAYIQRIVEAINPRHSDRVIEIGPGLGALTAPLLERLDSLHVVEIDRDIVARLAARFPGERLVVHQGDALEFDFATMGSGLRLIGNLPYNISTPMLFHTARFAACIRDCHFMLQEEVVDRMVAKPGGKSFGRLSVMLQYRFRVEKVFDVPPRAFRPVPRVNSALASLTPHAALPAPAQDELLLAQLVSKAFSQRRKTLRNALADYATVQELAALGLDPRLRPENLSLEDFVRVANAIASRARQT
jgi:16S rRNA (adenine1518-N6/adenine1519-N6)-dimethyltransferase